MSQSCFSLHVFTHNLFWLERGSCVSSFPPAVGSLISSKLTFDLCGTERSYWDCLGTVPDCIYMFSNCFLFQFKRMLNQCLSRKLKFKLIIAGKSENLSFPEMVCVLTRFNSDRTDKLMASPNTKTRAGLKTTSVSKVL